MEQVMQNEKENLSITKDEKSLRGYFQLFKDNVVFIALIIYGVSFVNFYLYYKSFDIPIFNYIGLNDLIFFFVEYLFKIILLIFVVEIILFALFGSLFLMYEKGVIYSKRKWRNLYLNSDQKTRTRIKEVFEKLFKKSLKSFRFFIMIISVFIIPFVPFKMLIFTTYFIYLFYLMDKLMDGDMSKFLLAFSGVILFISMVLSTLFNGYVKRYEKDDFIISFYENGKLITTDKKISCYNYLGETSSSIFLFDIESKESKIFNKENISELTIKNSAMIDESIGFFKSTYIYEVFSEMNQAK